MINPLWKKHVYYDPAIDSIYVVNFELNGMPHYCWCDEYNYVYVDDAYIHENLIYIGEL